MIDRSAGNSSPSRAHGPHLKTTARPRRRGRRTGQGGELGAQLRLVLGPSGSNLRQVALEHRSRRAAERALGLGVHLRNAAGLVDGDDSVQGVREDRRLLGIACPQCLLRPQTVGELTDVVADDRRRAEQLGPRIFNRSTGKLEDTDNPCRRSNREGEAAAQVADVLETREHGM